MVITRVYAVIRRADDSDTAWVVSKSRVNIHTRANNRKKRTIVQRIGKLLPREGAAV